MTSRTVVIGYKNGDNIIGKRDFSIDRR